MLPTSDTVSLMPSRWLCYAGQWQRTAIAIGKDGGSYEPASNTRFRHTPPQTARWSELTRRRWYRTRNGTRRLPITPHANRWSNKRTLVR